MRYALAFALWLLPCALFGREPVGHAEAATLLRRLLKELTPPTDATFGFTQTVNRLAHLSRPWQTYKRESAGAFVLAQGGATFYQADSVVSNERAYHAFTYFHDTVLARFDYGESRPDVATRTDLGDFPFDAAVLTPVVLLRAVLARDPERFFLRSVVGDVDSIVYRVEDVGILSLAIDRLPNRLRSASLLFDDDLYGDVVSTVIFDAYVESGPKGFAYPSKIVKTMLGIEQSVVTVRLSDEPFDRESVTAMIPADYRLGAERSQPLPEVTRRRYDEHIHLIDLKHTGAQVMIVEFNEFLMVAGAPLSSENGELILAQAREIAPDKPVRYFTFGHHHPHYIGGLRAFAHKRATILSLPMDTAYVRQLVTFRHTLTPDSLELEPRPLKLDVLDSVTSMTDGETEVRIMLIGGISRHAEDFLIYYFPQKKLLFQDELGWMAEGKPLTAASPRQKGLYDGIKLHSLDVETILQGWPRNRGVKTEFTFAELEESVKMIPPKP